jgi:hypothetical protein
MRGKMYKHLPSSHDQFSWNMEDLLNDGIDRSNKLHPTEIVKCKHENGIFRTILKVLCILLGVLV